MTNLLTDNQRETLKSLSKVLPAGVIYPTQANEALDEYIDILKNMYPEKFLLTKEDLNKRVFLGKPKGM